MPNRERKRELVARENQNEAVLAGNSFNNIRKLNHVRSATDGIATP